MKLVLGKCHRTPLIRQHCLSWWLGAVRQPAITWANVDPDLCCHMVLLGHTVWRGLFLLNTDTAENPVQAYWLLLHQVTENPAWITNYIHYFVWDVITHPCQLNSPAPSAAYAALNWISNGSDNGWLPVWCQPITWINTDLLSVRLLYVYMKKLQWNLNQNTKFFIHVNENFEMAAIFEGDELTKQPLKLGHGWVNYAIS